MITWVRLLPALLVSRQWTLAAWMVHMDNICYVYAYYKTSGKGSEFLVTLYEDRIRHHWSKQCESGTIVNLELEATKTNKEVMESCRTRLPGILEATGLTSKDSPQSNHQARQDEQASAALKQEANLAQERRRLQASRNALKQKLQPPTTRSRR